MNLNKANFAVSRVASADPTRRPLGVIKVTKHYTAATDGFRLAIVGLPKQIKEDETVSAIKTKSAKNLIPFAIPAKSARDIKFYKVGKFFPFINDTVYVDVEETNKNGTAKFTSTDLESVSSPAIKKADTDDWVWEDIFKPFPAPDVHVHEARVNIDYLIGLLEVARKVDKFVDIKMTDDPAKPIEFYTTSDDGQEFLGLLMPIRR